MNQPIKKLLLNKEKSKPPDWRESRSCQGFQVLFDAKNHRQPHRKASKPEVYDLDKECGTETNLLYFLCFRNSINKR